MMVVSVLWQSVAMAGLAPAAQATTDSAHRLLHWQGKAHHHHESNITVDDSHESTHHVALDDGAQALALTSNFAVPQVLIEHAPLPTFTRTGIPSPELTGLERPPRRMI